MRTHTDRSCGHVWTLRRFTCPCCPRGRSPCCRWGRATALSCTWSLHLRWPRDPLFSYASVLHEGSVCDNGPAFHGSFTLNAKLCPRDTHLHRASCGAPASHPYGRTSCYRSHRNTASHRASSYAWKGCCWWRKSASRYHTGRSCHLRGEDATRQHDVLLMFQ